MKTIKVVDLFCGAGGSSTGAALACEELDLKVDLLAINHWDIALKTHQANHPWARHLCKSLGEVNPKQAVPGGKLDLLIASPECTWHSVARGGKPINDQMRMSAWLVVDWLSALYVSNFIIENVREFRDWSPLDARNRPIKSRKGEIYQAFIGAIKALGYRLEERIVNAADHGDPTTRERLFILGRKSNRKISWPIAAYDETGMITGKKWRPAREIIDWSIESQSIFARKRPLSPNTMLRIAAGLKRFGGISFLLPHRKFDNAPVDSIDRPLRTVTATSADHGIVEPFLINLRGTTEMQIEGSAKSLDEPLPTLTACGHAGVVEPFILPHRAFQKGHVDSIEQPLRTFTATNGGLTALVEPFLSRFAGNHAGKKDGAERNRSLDQPIGTLDTSNRYGLCEPFLVPFFGERDGQEPRTHSIDDPLPAVTSHGAGGLAEPFLVTVNHGKGEEQRAHSLHKPAPTITTKNGLGLCQSFLVKYNSTGGAKSIDEPLDTVTTKDRFGLVDLPIVEINGEHYALDIRFRMLRPRELAAAMSFPKEYQFAGTQDQQVRQIGNAVAVNTAKALCKAILGKEKREPIITQRKIA